MNCDLLVNWIPAGDEEKQNLFRVSVVVHMESGVIVFFFKTSKQQLCLYFLLSLLPPKTFTFVLLILHVSFFFLFLPTHCHLTCRIFPLALWSHHFFPFTFFFFLSLKPYSWKNALTNVCISIPWENIWEFLQSGAWGEIKERILLRAFAVPHIPPKFWRLWPKRDSSSWLACL